MKLVDQSAGVQEEMTGSLGRGASTGDGGRDDLVHGSCFAFTHSMQLDVVVEIIL